MADIFVVSVFCRFYCVCENMPLGATLFFLSLAAKYPYFRDYGMRKVFVLMAVLLWPGVVVPYDEFDIMVCEAREFEELTRKCFIEQGIPLDPSLRKNDKGGKSPVRFHKDQLFMVRGLEHYADEVVEMLNFLVVNHPPCIERLAPETAGISSQHINLKPSSQNRTQVQSAFI